MRLEKEGNNIQDILAILVPKFIKDRMNQGLNFLQEAQDDVGIIFCDICDFDKIIKSEGQRIVQILDEIFRNFDNLCLKHGIQKIETVGKTYMACAGLKLCEVNFPEQVLKTEKTRRMVSMALEMMKYIQSLTYGKGEVIKIKIGIHNGRVISGVIGDHKPQFSLIGDTVNTTSRVCSTGVDGSIIISEEAYENVKNSNITFEQRVVQAKGKGDLITYVVLNQKKIKKFKKSKLKMKIEMHMPGLLLYILLTISNYLFELIEKPSRDQKGLRTNKTRQ
jgi:phospholipid-translocating ATPase